MHTKQSVLFIASLTVLTAVFNPLLDDCSSPPRRCALVLSMAANAMLVAAIGHGCVRIKQNVVTLLSPMMLFSLVPLLWRVARVPDVLILFVEFVWMMFALTVSEEVLRLHDPRLWARICQDDRYLNARGMAARAVARELDKLK